MKTALVPAAVVIIGSVAAFAATVIPGSDSGQGPGGTVVQDKGTKRVPCSKSARGAVLHLPGSPDAGVPLDPCSDVYLSTGDLGVAGNAILHAADGHYFSGTQTSTVTTTGTVTNTSTTATVTNTVTTTVTDTTSYSGTGSGSGLTTASTTGTWTATYTGTRSTTWTKTLLTTATSTGTGTITASYGLWDGTITSTSSSTATAATTIAITATVTDTAHGGATRTIAAVGTATAATSSVTATKTAYWSWTLPPGTFTYTWSATATGATTGTLTYSATSTASFTDTNTATYTSTASKTATATASASWTDYTTSTWTATTTATGTTTSTNTGTGTATITASQTATMSGTDCNLHTAECTLHQVSPVQIAELSTTFSNNTETLQDVTALTVNVVAGKVYHLRAYIPETAGIDEGSDSGTKIKLSGTATFTRSRMYVWWTPGGDPPTNAVPYIDFSQIYTSEAIGSTYTSDSTGGGVWLIDGTVVVVTSGTIVVQWAAKTYLGGTYPTQPAILAGAYLEVLSQ